MIVNVAPTEYRLEGPAGKGQQEGLTVAVAAIVIIDGYREREEKTCLSRVALTSTLALWQGRACTCLVIIRF